MTFRYLFPANSVDKQALIQETRPDPGFKTLSYFEYGDDRLDVIAITC